MKWLTVASCTGRDLVRACGCRHRFAITHCNCDERHMFLFSKKSDGAQRCKFTPAKNVNHAFVARVTIVFLLCKQRSLRRAVAQTARAALTFLGRRKQLSVGDRSFPSSNDHRPACERRTQVWSKHWRGEIMGRERLN